METTVLEPSGHVRSPPGAGEQTKKATAWKNTNPKKKQKVTTTTKKATATHSMSFNMKSEGASEDRNMELLRSVIEIQKETIKDQRETIQYERDRTKEFSKEFILARTETDAMRKEFLEAIEKNNVDHSERCALAAQLERAKTEIHKDQITIVKNNKMFDKMRQLLQHARAELSASQKDNNNTNDALKTCQNEMNRTKSVITQLNQEVEYWKKRSETLDRQIKTIVSSSEKACRDLIAKKKIHGTDDPLYKKCRPGEDPVAHVKTRMSFLLKHVEVGGTEIEEGRAHDPNEQQGVSVQELDDIEVSVDSDTECHSDIAQKRQKTE